MTFYISALEILLLTYLLDFNDRSTLRRHQTNASIEQLHIQQFQTEYDFDIDGKYDRSILVVTRQFVGDSCSRMQQWVCGLAGRCRSAISTDRPAGPDQDAFILRQFSTETPPSSRRARREINPVRRLRWRRRLPLAKTFPDRPDCVMVVDVWHIMYSGICYAGVVQRRWDQRPLWTVAFWELSFVLRDG